MIVAVRGSPILFLLVFAPLAVMLFRLIRMRLRRRLRAAIQALVPGPGTPAAGRETQLA